MTAVRSVRSTAYGAKLFAYVFAVAAVGGGLLGLGYSLAWPTLGDVALGDAPVEEPATLAAGTVLGLLGVYVLGAGLLGALHKLVADGVAAGVENAEMTTGVATPAGDAESVGSADQSADGETSADRSGPESRPRPEGNSSPDSGPATGSEGAAAGATASGTATVDGTDETATGGQPETTPDADETGSGTVGSPPDPNGPASPGATGTAAPGATEGTGQAAKPDARGGAPEGSDAEPAAEAAEVPDAADESGTETTEPGGAPGPDRETDAVPGLDDVDDGGDAWTPPDDLDPEPVDVETSDTVPVDGDGEPDPGAGDVGVDDVGPSDQLDDPSPDPPEPSPEEIAFGSSGGGADQESSRDAGTDTGGEDGTVTERADWFEEDVEEGTNTEPAESEPTESAGKVGGFEPAGSTAPSDPLADPNETE